MEPYQKISKRFLESKTSVHLCFVTVIVLINLVWLGASSKFLSLYPYILITLMLQLTGIYAGRWIFRKYFYWGMIDRFVGYTFLLLLILFLLGCLGLMAIEKDTAYLVKCSLISFFNILPAMLTGIFLTLLRTSLRTQMNEAVTAQRQKESELSLLLSQLSPHFLFNTLNNLYGLSITRDDRISELLLKLSDLLRYSLYETKHNYVSLTEEIKYISNYIELEKIRIGKRLSLTCQVDINQSGTVKIAPMLLIVFLENAFKHAKNTYSDQIFIAIQILEQGEEIYISIKNSYVEHLAVLPADENSGLGIANAMKRLELLYQQDYQLEQKAADGFYELQLRLKTR